MRAEAQEGTKKKPDVKGFGDVTTDTYLLCSRAAADTGVLLAKTAGPGEKYMSGAIIRRLPSHRVKFRTTGDAASIERYQLRRRELEEMLDGKRDVPDELQDLIDKAQEARASRLASYRRPSPRSSEI